MSQPCDSITLDNGSSLANLQKFNVLLGKNGSGKSTLLRAVDKKYATESRLVRYITPERGGTLRYEGSIETNEGNVPNWLDNQRRNNQFQQFRQSSVLNFRRLEIQVLRSIEAEPEVRASNFTFESEIKKINELLDRISLRRADAQSFEILDQKSKTVLDPNTLSSGESELISLAVEILLFARLCSLPKYNSYTNWLLMDEPDVHLHPDLQYRLMKLIVNAISGIDNARILIATHSTSILSALISEAKGLQVGFKTSGEKQIQFEPATEVLQDILPMFGAHPLSSVFNERPILIVEGEDDERIWSQAIRSSQGRLKIYPCVAGDIQSMDTYETEANRVLGAIYDGGKGFSIRDKDEAREEIGDVGKIIRARLSCRAAENLLLSDDVLELLETDWSNLVTEMENWLTSNRGHVRHDDVATFKKGGWKRKSHNIKSIRNLIVGLSGSSKPWEIAVGQAISNLPKSKHTGTNCLSNYLGKKVVDMLNLDRT